MTFRIAAVLIALALLALAVPLEHVDEIRRTVSKVDLSAVAPLGAKAEAAQAAVCDRNPKDANLNFVLKDANGKDFNLASQKGKVILLDFWATWCPPCKVEIPWFVEFQQKFGPKGFIVIGVSVDDPASKLKPFGDQYKVNYPLLVGDGRNDIKGPRGYNAAWGLPKTFVIGRDGKICKTHVGLSVKEHFEQQIKSLL
jgi:cytochrome c biogenesis protein CcmG/thiol:disulfide interchange protein DsbE